jgi:hypothetical protein
VEVAKVPMEMEFSRFPRESGKLMHPDIACT